MRLIDADAVAEAIRDELAEAKEIDADPNFVAGLRLGHAYINTAEPVDVVLVVRCRDCKYYVPDEDGDPHGGCTMTYSYMSEDGYCSDGERKAEP